MESSHSRLPGCGPCDFRGLCRPDPFHRPTSRLSSSVSRPQLLLGDLAIRKLFCDLHYFLQAVIDHQMRNAMAARHGEQP